MTTDEIWELKRELVKLGNKGMYQEQIDFMLKNKKFLDTQFCVMFIISFEYKKKLVEENEQLKSQIERMKNHNNCKWFHEWNLADVMNEPLDDLSPCQGCKNFNLWEFAE